MMSQIQSSSSPTHSYSTSSPTKSSSSDPATPPKHKTTPTTSSHAHHNNPYIQTGKIVNNQQQYSHGHSHIGNIFKHGNNYSIKLSFFLRTQSRRSDSTRVSDILPPPVSLNLQQVFLARPGAVLWTRIWVCRSREKSSQLDKQSRGNVVQRTGNCSVVQECV